jgi:predicted transcriptional regulator
MGFPVQLSDIQLDVMCAIWSAGRATTASVHETVGTPRGLAYTTISTVLTRLEKRGLLRSEKDGRERVFEALVSEASVRRRMVSSLVSTLFRGDAPALVSQLIGDGEIDAGDLEKIRRLLQESKTDE